MRVNLSLKTLPLFLLIMACGSKPHSAPSGEANLGARHNIEKFEVSNEWKPDQIEVVCASSPCPPQVGALLFVGRETDQKKIQIQRCTAFLIGLNRIMSNGHCDFLSTHKGYFVTQRVGGRKEIFEIKSVFDKRYTPSQTQAVDVAIFNLDRNVDYISPLKLASGPQIAFDKLIAFSIARSNENELSVERHECKVRRHEQIFPYSVSEGTEVIKSFDCVLKEGMSGSPMFAPGSDDVQAVHAASFIVDLLKPKEKLEQKSQMNHSLSISTNVRCLDLKEMKPEKCIKLSDEAIQKRINRNFRDTFNQFISAQQQIVDGVQLKPFPYNLKSKEDGVFEVILYPDCERESSRSRDSLPFVFEQVVFRFGNWGERYPHVLSRSEVRAKATMLVQSRFDVTMDWPKSPLPYLNPELDLRNLFGERFRVDLPLCSR